MLRLPMWLLQMRLHQHFVGVLLGTAAAFSTAPWLTAPQPLQFMYRKLMLQTFRGAT